MLTMILATALVAQRPEAELRALRDEINARAAARNATPEEQARDRARKESREADMAAWRQKEAIERPLREAALRARREAMARAEAAAAAKARAEYLAMLPYLQAQQRMELQRLSDIERNTALHRMAAAAELQAQVDRQRLGWIQYQNLYRPR